MKKMSFVECSKNIPAKPLFNKHVNQLCFQIL